jgi:hypothetical protein
MKITDSCFQKQINNGITTEEAYPYQGVNGTCRRTASQPKITISGYYDTTAGSDEDLMTAIATVGPVPALINASLQTLQFYKTGVYSDPLCSPDILTHAVSLSSFLMEYIFNAFVLFHRF